MGRRTVPFLFALLLGVSHAQQSASYVSERVALSAAAGSAASGSFTTTVTVAQQGPSGAASLCNDGWLVSVGFFSILGASPVPIVLRAERDPIDPGTVQLEWSGAVAQFDLYRVTADAAGIGDPANLDRTLSLCTAADTNAAEADLVFYRVVAGGTP